MSNKFIGCNAKYEDAKIIMFGAGFDGTTTFRPGTRFAPSVIRVDSYGLESYSVYQGKDLEDSLIHDSGDIELVFGNSRGALNQINEVTNLIVKDDKKPFMIGGEHLVTLGTIESLSSKYSDLHIIHFDAHTDLREEYLGESLSHSTVMRRCHDLLGDNKIYQFGIRSGLKEEFEWAKKHTKLNLYNLSKLDMYLDELIDKPVYISIDLDILDPSVFPGTGTPEPGGISFNELLNAILKFKKLKKIVGADVVELAPNYDQTGASNAVACKVIRELLLAMEG